MAPAAGEGGERRGDSAQRQSARRAAVRRLAHLPTSERRAETQRRLLEAGRRVIAENGVGGASVGLITAEAGFSRGAFYSNFSDMDHFVQQVAQHEWDSVLTAIGTRLREEIDSAPDPAPHPSPTTDEGGAALVDVTADGQGPPAAGTGRSGPGAQRPGTEGPGSEGTEEVGPAPTGPGASRAAANGSTASAAWVAENLLQTTRPLLGHSGRDSTGALRAGAGTHPDGRSDYVGQLTVFSHALLAAIPRDREFYLLWSSLANLMVRFPEESAHLRESFLDFRDGMAAYIVEALDTLDLEPRIGARDLADLVIAIGARSTRNRLIDPAGDGDELLERVLPVLLPGLAGPRQD
ncbi:TetR/AcrR family transcriptional regulator [Actinomyces polynesiensis]|uniref:TetR/AcrR family transcriptional regulator n=1 Tax=Actinomyces polynesiensis TaxID=1325934 RepID=UPI000694419B|nr:TetR/AcrR family transcriptional regulator [Actinomyces polynesiensis]